MTLIRRMPAPGSEAERLLQDVDPANHLAFYVHGFGLGYHVELLFDRAAPEAMRAWEAFCRERDATLGQLEARVGHSDLGVLVGPDGGVHASVAHLGRVARALPAAAVRLSSR